MRKLSMIGECLGLVGVYKRFFGAVWSPSPPNIEASMSSVIALGRRGPSFSYLTRRIFAIMAYTNSLREATVSELNGVKMKRDASVIT